MRWLWFLLLLRPAAAQTRAAKPLWFDLTALAARRDSFRFVVDGRERGFAVWQYDSRREAAGEQVVFTQHSELQPVEEEQTRLILDRRSGRPVSLFYHMELFAPASDTLVVEVDLAMTGDTVVGQRRVRLKDERQQQQAVRRLLPPGAVWSMYEFYAAAATNALPGDSLAAPSYRETRDSITVLWFVAEQPTSVRVPAGRFDVLPLRSGDFRLYVTRVAPRRVVKGETTDGRFSFELAGTGPVIPAER